MPTPVDVAAQETQAAATHHSSLTAIPAGVFVHEGCTVQPAKHSVSGAAAVFALLGGTAVHPRHLIRIPASANAQPSNSVQAHSVSTPTPVSVSVQTVPRSVPSLLRFSTHAHANASAHECSRVLETRGSTLALAGVSALHHVQSALDHKLSIMSPVNVNAPPHGQNALLHKCSMTGPVGASVQK